MANLFVKLDDVARPHLQKSGSRARTDAYMP